MQVSIFNLIELAEFMRGRRTQAFALPDERTPAERSRDFTKFRRLLARGAAFLQNTPFRFGPIALTNVMTTNILNPGTTTGGVNCTGSPYGNLFILLRNIRVCNKHASTAATFNLYIGATGANAAGTELAFTIPVPVGGEYNISPPGGIRLDVADFLVGGSNTATALTIEGHGEIGISK